MQNPNTGEGRQVPLDPGAGFVAAVRTRRRCPGNFPGKDCGAALPPGSSSCLVCGWARPLFGGEEYPAGDVRRYAWTLAQPVGDPTAKLVLLALAHHDRPNGRGIFPRIEELARLTSCSHATIHRALRRLERDGWILVEQRRLRGRQSSSRYRIRQAETVGTGSQNDTLSGSHFEIQKGTW